MTIKKVNPFMKVVNLIYPTLISLGIIVVFWETACRVSGVPKWMIAKPSDIASIFIKNTSEIAPYIRTTYLNVLFGYLLAVVIGIVVAILVTSFETLSDAITPVIIAICCVPIITLVPLLMLVLGTGNSVKIITIVIQSFPIINMNAATAFINTDPNKLELMKSLKASKTQTFIHCILKDSLPGVFTGLKLGAIMAMMGGITAEMTGGNTGIGARISYYVGYSRIPEALSCVLYIVFLGAILYGGVCILEYVFVKRK